MIPTRHPYFCHTCRPAAGAREHELARRCPALHCAHTRHIVSAPTYIISSSQ
jgi:hypothetical protein